MTVSATGFFTAVDQKFFHPTIGQKVVEGAKTLGAVVGLTDKVYADRNVYVGDPLKNSFSNHLLDVLAFTHNGVMRSGMWGVAKFTLVALIALGMAITGLISLVEGLMRGAGELICGDQDVGLVDAFSEGAELNFRVAEKAFYAAYNCFTKGDSISAHPIDS